MHHHVSEWEVWVSKWSKWNEWSWAKFERVLLGGDFVYILPGICWNAPGYLCLLYWQPLDFWKSQLCLLHCSVLLTLNKCLYFRARSWSRTHSFTSSFQLKHADASHYRCQYNRSIINGSGFDNIFWCCRLQNINLQTAGCLVSMKAELGVEILSLIRKLN